MASPADFDLSDAPDIFGDTPSLEGIASEERGLALAGEPVEQEVAPFGGFDLSDAPDIFAVEEEPVVAKGDAFGGFDLSDAPDIFGDTQQDSAFQLDDDNPFSDSAPITSPIPGLTSRGGEVINLPDVLTDEPPSEFAGREGHLSRDEASMLWYQTVQEYNVTKDTAERVKILGRFMRAWDPEEAERMGLRKDGFVEPEGFWKLLDALDKPAKTIRTLINTMYDLRKEEAASIATDGEIGTPDMESVANALQRNWAEDKGTPEDGARAMRSAGLWLATMLEPETKDGAKNVLTAEAGWEEGEDALADWLVEAGWDAASPLIKAFGDKTDEEIQESIRKSIEEGSAGGHFAIGLMGLILIDPLNALAGFGGAAKGAGAAAKGLLGGGVDLTPAGVEAVARHTKNLEGKARQIMLGDLAKVDEISPETLGGLQEISDRMNRVDEAISSYGERLVELEGVSRGAPSARIASAELINEQAIPRLTELKARLVEEFDDAIDLARRGDGPPASELRHAAESRAAVLAVADYNDATNLAWQRRVPLRGDFAVSELGKIRALAAIDTSVDAVAMENAWVSGLARAGREEGVLVGIQFDDAGKAIETTIKSPEVARIYRKALDGELGVAAKVAAERPQYDILESLLKKREGTKGFDEMKAAARQEILDIAKSGTTRTSRFSEAVFDPIVSIGKGKKGRETLAAHRASVARKTDLVSGVDPLGFRMAYALAGKAEWIDRSRRALAGVASLTRRPAAYAMKNDAGEWTKIPREELLHPAMHYKAQQAERNRLRARTLMMQKWPAIRAEIKAITDDPEVLKLARHFVEKGWADLPDAVQAQKELLTAVSLRTLKEIVQSIDESAVVVRGVKALPDGEVKKAVAALRQLVDPETGKAVDGISQELVDDLIGEVEAHGELSGLLLSAKSERAAMKRATEGAQARKARLASLRERITLFSAAFEAQVSAVLRTSTDREIAKIADELQPQVNQFQEQLAQIERQLQAKTTDDDQFKPLVNEVDNLLRELGGGGRGAAGARADTPPVKTVKSVGGKEVTSSVFSLPGGRVEIWESSPWAPGGAHSIVNFVVDESVRGQGIGGQLIDQVIRAYPGKDISGQVSSLASLKVLHNRGFRHQGAVGAGFDELVALFKDGGSSLAMVRLKTAPTEGVVSRPVGDLPVKGRGGKPIVHADGTPPPLNEDGTITLYYWTNKAVADYARKTGTFKDASHSASLTLSSRMDGARPAYSRGVKDQNSGDVLVELRIDPKHAAPVKALDGEVHVSVTKKNAIVAPPDATPVSKEPWKVPQEASGLSLDEHFAEVQGALAAGKFVPVEVLVKYPSETFQQLSKTLRKDLDRIGAAKKEFNIALAKVDEVAAKDIPVGEDALLKALRVGEGAAAKRALERARTNLRSLTASKQLAEIERAMRKAIRAGKKRDFVVPYRSPKRVQLETQRARLRGEIASIHAQVQDEATLLRAEAAEQKKVLLEQIIPKENLSKEGEERLRGFVGSLQKVLTGDEPAISAIPRGRVDKMVKALADPKLAENIERKRRYARTIKDPVKREAYEAAVELSLEETLSALRPRAIRESTPLQDAINMKASGAPQKGLPGKDISRDEVVARLGGLDQELKGLLRAMDEVNYDFRSNKAVRDSLDEAVSSHVNKMETAAASFNQRMDAFDKAASMAVLDKLPATARARVERMVKDPSLHDLLSGKPAAIDDMTAEMSKAQEKLQRLVAAGKGETKGAKAVQGNIDTLAKRIEILRDADTSEDVIRVAGVMKGFFDDWLGQMKKAGVVDRNLSPDDFYARVDVGGYIPHMKSLATQAKVQALRGRGLLPSAKLPGFLSKREIPGVVDDINLAQRNEIAEAVLYHQAERGTILDEGAQAASREMRLKEYVDDLYKENPSQNRSWEQMVEDARIEHGLDDLYDFFETDPMVLMERYNSMASRAVSDAEFIEDTLDLFPMGRHFAKRYGDKADHYADMAGYIRLDKVSHLESVIKAKLPDGLRKFSGLINEQLSKGVSRREIMEQLREAGVEGVTDDIIDGFTTTDVFVPKQVASYLNWMNSSDAAYANSVFGQNADAVHSWMKAQATIIALGHIGRNFIGNVVSSSQELGLAAINPVNQIKAARIWGTWGDKALNAPVQIGKYTKTVSEWRELFKKRGFFDISLSHDFMLETTGVAKEVASTPKMLKSLGLVGAGALSGAAMGAMAGLAPLGAFAGVSAGLLGARRWSGTRAVRGGGVVERFIGMTADEIKRAPREAKVAKLNVMSGAIAGGLVGSTFGPVGAAVGASIGALTMPDYLKMMSQLNTSVEAQARLSMAVGAIGKGADLDSALVSTNKALRDYSDLTPLEKNVLRRVFFFYTWEAGNMKFQLDWLRRRPRAANMTASFLNGVFKGQFTEDEITSIPEHMRTKVLLRTGAGRIIALSGLPQEPMLDLLTRGKRGVPTGLLTRVNPIPLTMAEWLLGGGKSVYYGKDWEEINNVRKLKNAPNGLKQLVGYPEEGDETWVPIYKDGAIVGYKPDFRAKNPGLLYLMTKVPMWRVMQQYMILSADTYNSFAMDAGMPGQKATKVERLGAFALGWKPTTIDFEQNKNYMAWRLEQRLLKYINNRNRNAVKPMMRLRSEFSGPAIPMTPLDDGEDE